VSTKIRTWVWILLAVFGVCVLALVAIAGAGVYFVSHHIALQKTTSADARRSFDAARAQFTAAKPLIELDRLERGHEARALGALPTSAVRAENLYVLAWNPEEGRLVKVSLPFWLLRLRNQKMDFLEDVELDRLNVDLAELERVGPALVLDHQTPTGQRVLMWTQ
jgi:hypothetical protein